MSEERNVKRDRKVGKKRDKIRNTLRTMLMIGSGLFSLFSCWALLKTRKVVELQRQHQPPSPTTAAVAHHLHPRKVWQTFFSTLSLSSPFWIVSLFCTKNEITRWFRCSNFPKWKGWRNSHSTLKMLTAHAAMHEHHLRWWKGWKKKENSEEILYGWMQYQIFDKYKKWKFAINFLRNFYVCLIWKVNNKLILKFF